jgi:hypothetical protein
MARATQQIASCPSVIRAASLAFLMDSLLLSPSLKAGVRNLKNKLEKIYRKVNNATLTLLPGVAPFILLAPFRVIGIDMFSINRTLPLHQSVGRISSSPCSITRPGLGLVCWLCRSP